MAMMKKNLKGDKVARQRAKLPSKVTEPSDALSDYSMLIYGAKKVGKTTIAAQFPDPLFLATEPGTKALRVKSAPVRTWQDMLDLVAALEEKFAAGEEYCGTVVMDTADLAYERCFEHVCRKAGITHPSEINDYGKTWRDIKASFRDVVVRLLSLPCGCIFISHDQEKEIELRDGRKVDRTQPTMAGQALSEIEGIVDVIAYYGFNGRKRQLLIRGDQTTVAGTRLKEHFVRKGGKPGRAEDRVVAIPLGDSEEQAYRALTRAFDNEQEDVGVEEDAPEKPSKLKKKVKLKR